MKNAAAPATGGGAGSSKPVQTEFRFLAPTGVASPLLFLAVVSGKRLASAVFSVVRPGEQPFLEVQITLADVRLTQYENYPDPEDASPLDLVSLTYNKITYSYFTQDAKGGVGSTVTSSWDFTRNAQT